MKKIRLKNPMVIDSDSNEEKSLKFSSGRDIDPSEEDTDDNNLSILEKEQNINSTPSPKSRNRRNTKRPSIFKPKTNEDENSKNRS